MNNENSLAQGGRMPDAAGNKSSASSSVLTPAEVAEILARAEKATPEPWKGDRNDGTVKYSITGSNGDLVLAVQHKSGEFGFIGPRGDADEAFVLAARSDVPALCATITSLRGLIEGMGHEEGCDGSMCGTCGQARDKHYKVASTVFCTRSVTDARRFQAKPCNCVQSKVNL